MSNRGGALDPRPGIPHIRSARAPAPLRDHLRTMPSDSDLLTEARRMLAAGRRREARTLLEPLVSRTGCEPSIVRQLAELEIEEGEGERALGRLRPLEAAGDDEAAFLAARADAALGRLAEARSGFVALRARLGTPSAMLEVHLAAVEQRLGDTQGALAALHRAIALEPTLAPAHESLAGLLVSFDLPAQARTALEQAVAVLPGNGRLWAMLARVLSDLGDSEAALASASAAARAAAGDAGTWRQAGALFAEYWRWEDADRALAEASRLDPGLPATETLRSVVKQELGDTAGALAALERARARDPGDLHAALGERLILPQVYEDDSDLARWRERYTEGLAAMVREIPRWLERAPDVFQLHRNNFLLAYQGEDDRELQRAHSGFIARLAERAHPQWREERRVAFPLDRRIRIGFVGAIFRDCTAGRYFERWVTGLDPARFERFVYHTAPLSDDFTRRISAASEHFATLRAGTAEAAARIDSDRLDVLLHPEVGMTPMSYVLAALRLAPVQCAGWGHPVTTGSDVIDRYITCAMMEPPGGSSHYVEPLLALPGLGVDYAMPPAPQRASRADFGLPASGRLYLCAQSLFKVHPDMDALVADVIEGDPQAVVAFFQAPVAAITRRFADRLQRTLAKRAIPARGQVKFLPRMNGEYFRRVVGICDVVLDTVHWSGGNTSLDAFAAATPVVTLPGRFMRGRQTAAMLAAMGLTELVAANSRDYVRIALDTARDRDRNAALREAIVRNRQALFDRPEAIAALQDALEAAVAAKS